MQQVPSCTSRDQVFSWRSSGLVPGCPSSGSGGYVTFSRSLAGDTQRYGMEQTGFTVLFTRLCPSFFHWSIYFLLISPFFYQTGLYLLYSGMCPAPCEIIWNTKTESYHALSLTSSLPNQGMKQWKRSFKCHEGFKRAWDRSCNWAKRWERKLCQRAAQEKMHKNGIHRLGGMKCFPRLKKQQAEHSRYRKHMGKRNIKMEYVWNC